MSSEFASRLTAGRFVETAPQVIICCVLALRCLLGLDLSDEMQYYGQIRALLDQGRLFSTDLFLQQLVYVLFYPAFKLHQLVFGTEGLIFFGRAMLAMLLLTLFLYARRQFIKGGARPWRAGCAAAALTFCVPYHGVFALSYNTVSQLGWAVFVVWYWRWDARGWWQWAALICIGGLAHPVAGLCMAGLIGVRLLMERRWTHAGEFGLWMTAGAAGALLTVLQFASLEELVESLRFSRGFSVGNAWLASPVQFWSGIAYLAAILVVSCLPVQWLRRVPARPLMLACLIGGIAYLARRGEHYGYTPGIFFIGALLTLLALVHLVVSSGDAERGRIRWFVAALASHFLSLVITSSNGLAQGTGAVWLAVPLLIGMWPEPSEQPARSSSNLGNTNAWLGGLALIFFVTHWTAYPYRDRPWFSANTEASGVSEFRFIRVSRERAWMLQAFRESLSGELAERSTLIVSGLPALYFALGVRPATCMLYMHSLPRGDAAETFERCMGQRFPDAILQVIPPPNDPASLAPAVWWHTEQFARIRGLTRCAWRELPMPNGTRIEPVGEGWRFRLCVHP